MDGGEIQPALPGAQVGDVGDPQHVRLAGPELAFDEIVSDPDAGHTDRGAALLDLHEPRDPGLAHQPLDPLTRDVNTLAEAKLGLHPPRTVDTTSTLVNGRDLLGQPRVAERTIGRCAALPLVKPRSGHAEHLAHHRDWEAGPLPPRRSGKRSPGLGLRCEKDRGSLENVALLFDALDATTQFAQLLAFSARQPIVALVLIEPVLLDPVMQRLLAAAQAPRLRL